MTGTAYILTHHSLPNFGANLQALATARALQERGIAARFVDFRPPELEAKYADSVVESQRAAHADFVARHLQVTDAVADQAGFAALCSREPADLYVTGSDAVFRLDASSTRADLTFPNPYWLVDAVGSAFESPCKVALAPSAMGYDFQRLPASVREGARDALADFDLLSVRDAWTGEQVSGLGIEREVQIVPDPVFSLSPLLNDLALPHRDERPYVAVCTQGRKTGAWVAALTQRAEAAGFDTLAVPTPEGRIDYGTTRSLPLPLDPLTWAGAIAGAAGYVGGRFHPVVVSLAVGNAAVALDLYHAHPLERARSKTWQIMRRFGLGQACHSRIAHRLLTPGIVWRQLLAQMPDAQERRATADVIAVEVNAWFDRIANTKRVGAASPP